LGKLRVLSGREVCRILEQQGFSAARRRGSHVVRQKRTADSTGTGTVPDHATLHIGPLLSIIRQSGLPRALFEHD
jgi:predicted RNA binding protein YcfA (HicA-like mRNA interferase family)